MQWINSTVSNVFTMNYSVWAVLDSNMGTLRICLDIIRLHRDLISVTVWDFKLDHLSIWHDGSSSFHFIYLLLKTSHRCLCWRMFTVTHSRSVHDGPVALHNPFFLIRYLSVKQMGVFIVHFLLPSQWLLCYRVENEFACCCQSHLSPLSHLKIHWSGV